MMNQEIKNLIMELRMESSINCQVDFREGGGGERIYIKIIEKIVLFEEWKIFLKFFQDRGFMFYGFDFMERKVVFGREKEKVQLE